jgi:hypothetical protein
MAEQSQKYSASLEYRVLTLRNRVAITLPLDEWQDVRNKVDSIADGGSFFFAAGNLLIGFGLSALLAGLTFHLAPPKICPKESTTAQGCSQAEVVTYLPEITSIGVGLIALSTGALSFFFGKENIKLQNRTKRGVCSDMDMILKRYEDP